MVFHCSLFQQLKKKINYKAKTEQQTKPDNSTILLAFQQDNNCWKPTVIFIAS